MDQFFHNRASHRPRIREILNFLGQPDGISPQCIYSKAEGSGKASRNGGTLRFLLDDGGEVHVWTPNYSDIDLAIRYRKKGNSILLYK